MNSGGSSFIGVFSDKTTRCGHFQTVALYQMLKPALLNIVFNLGRVVVIVAEGFK